MITINNSKDLHIGEGGKFIEGVCLSTDTKPTGSEIANGSILLEMDTSTLYMYDRDSTEWRAWE